MSVSIDTHPGRGVSVEVMVDLALAKLPTDLSGPNGGAKSIMFTARPVGVPDEVVIPGFVTPAERDKALLVIQLSTLMRERGVHFTCFLHDQNNGPGVWRLTVIWASHETPLVRYIRDGLGKFAAQQELVALGGVTN